MARLNLYGSKMFPVINYNHTYTPVAAWESIHIILATVLHNNFNTMQLN